MTADKDPYAQAAAEWEAARSLVASLDWKWKPDATETRHTHFDARGTLTCDLSARPEDGAERVRSAIERYTELSPLLMGGNITVPCRLGEFESVFGFVVAADEKEQVKGPWSKRMKAEELKSYHYERSKSGESIVAQAEQEDDAQRLSQALTKRGVTGIHVSRANGRWNAVIPISQQEKLEEMGIAIHSYSQGKGSSKSA